MMYPRLKLARNLLREDGVIFVSLDDGEIENLRWIASEIFGEENFVAQILWKKRSTPPNDKIIGANHDYIALFCKNSNAVTLNLKERSQVQIERYQNPDNHPKGQWAPGDLMANIKGGRYVESLNYPIINPKTGQQHMPSETERGNWRFSKEKIGELLSRGEIYFGEDGRGRPKLKRFLCDVKAGVTYSTIWDFVPFNTEGSSEMQELFGNSSVFESPKPVGLLQEILKLGSCNDDVVLDFFAGSGSTGHAVIAQNSRDSGHRRYILVQLPEPLDTSKGEQKTAADYCDQLGKPRTIAELTKERLRRAAAKVKAENPMFAGDTGFRVFKLDTSNIRAWNPNSADLEQTLFDHQDHLVEGRTESDILYELLLKLGLDLCVPIEQRDIAGKMVHSVGGGVLMACLSTAISRDDVEVLAQGIIAWHKKLALAGDTTCVFRDSAFADDVAKTNLAAILEQYGIQNVRSL
jgi:adenine-specific DNA-methyltransferase